MVRRQRERVKSLRRIRRFHRKNRKGKRGREQGEINYWQSYSDLMAAMVLVFALIIAFTIYRAKEDYENIGREAEEKEVMLLKQGEELERLTGRLEELEEELVCLRQQETKTDKLLEEKMALEEQNDRLIKQKEELEEKLRELEERAEKAYAVRRDIVEELEEEFSGSVDIDPASGTVSFDSKVLFAYNNSWLSDAGKKTLDDFFPAYFSVILRNYDSISEVIIEGHCDDRGDYSYNMELSQARAFAVMNYCIGDEKRRGKEVNYDMFSESDLKKIREIVTVNGRSYYELIYKENGEVDEDASRRVEIKFRLEAENLLLGDE